MKKALDNKVLVIFAAAVMLCACAVGVTLAVQAPDGSHDAGAKEYPL